MAGPKELKATLASKQAAPSRPTAANKSSGPEEDKLRARVKAARAGMQAAGKNKADYERHEMQFEESMEALLKMQGAKVKAVQERAKRID